jgi:hypothetical protein
MQNTWSYSETLQVSAVTYQNMLFIHMYCYNNNEDENTFSTCRLREFPTFMSSISGIAYMQRFFMTKKKIS